MFNAGIIENFSTYFETLGVPQGGILSPFLFNVYMTEFDVFMKQLKTKTLVPTVFKNKDAIKARDNLDSEFSSQRIHVALKKYGSVENVRKV